ncbi:MAG: hypothetical protein IPG02_13365 [Ignavibacteria bacterium]|nr:hypothetical protein [Ignavibacteria bacterium]
MRTTTSTNTGLGVYSRITGTNFPYFKRQTISRINTAQSPGQLRQKDLYTGYTSGSSGHPFRYAKDKFSHAMTWALIKDRYTYYDLTLDSKQARFYGIPFEK